jgi:hypothetical protein
MPRSNRTGKGPNFKDLTGEVFGRLTVLRFSRMSRNNKSIWLCLCECGTEKEILGVSLTRKKDPVVSCGCWMREKAQAMFTTHGLTNLPEYRTWADAKGRCYCKTNKAYPDYGGRGIVMSDEWKDDFARFLADVGPRPGPGFSLDRKDVNGPYAAWNCRWAPPLVQGNNTRRNRPLTFQGRTMNLSQWAREIGIKPGALFYRLKRGASIEEALTRPLRQQGTLTPEERRLHKLARLTVRDRVRRGRIPHVSTLQCIHCGKPAEHYHHYAGYDRANRLKIHPVCKDCHPLSGEDEST